MRYWALSCSIPETVSRSRRIPIQASLAVTFHYLTRVLPHNNWTRLEYSTAKNSVWHCIPDSYFRRVRQYKSTFKYLDQCISTHALTFHYLCEQPATVGPVPIVLLPICQQRCRRYELWVTWESGERGGNAKTAGSQAWDIPCHENHTFSLYRTFLRLTGVINCNVSKDVESNLSHIAAWEPEDRCKNRHCLCHKNSLISQLLPLFRCVITVKMV